MRYKIAIFDMDGTILNTIDDLADSTNHILKEYNMPTHTVDEIKSFVGNGIHKLIERAVEKGTSDEVIEEVFNSFNAYYKDHCAIKTRAYDGIEKLICELKKEGVITAVVSNKADYGVQSLCKQYFDGLFDFAVGDKAGQRRKPYPDSVYAVLDKFKIEKKDAVYIGDSEVDVATAKNAGIDLFAVSWGFRTKDVLINEGASYIVDSPKELLKLMKEA